MAGTVKEILGTCFSVGCTVNGLPPREVQKQIDNGEIKVEDYEAPVEEKKEE
jgi:large subunit ribosomal protein L12e